MSQKLDASVLILFLRVWVCADSVTEQGGWVTINYYRKDPLFLSTEVPLPPHTHLLGSKCLPPEERRLPMPETGEKERNYLFKSYTDLE